MYDNNADIFGFIYNGTEYFYVKNAQNDVVAITDSTGKVIANYYYDDWGKLIETTGNTEIANLNPIRYRSYYYDSETGWYYLNTRYYAPEMSRFLNADSVAGVNQDINAYNIFAYCSNNPINCFDDNGQGKVFNWIKQKYNNAVSWIKSTSFVKAISAIGKSSAVTAGDAIADNKIQNTYEPMKEVVYKIPKGPSVSKFVPKNPSLSRLKAFSKTVGVVSAVSVGVDIVNNFITYGNSFENFTKANLITIGMAGVGVLAGVMLSACNMPVVMVIGVSVGVGVGLSYIEDGLKEEWIGY